MAGDIAAQPQAIRAPLPDQSGGPGSASLCQQPSNSRGFWVLPEFAAQSSFNGIEITGGVRSLFLYEPDIDALKERLYDRDGERGMPSDQPGRLRMFHEHGLLIKQRAEALGLPTLEARPFETLLERALAALS